MTPPSDEPREGSDPERTPPPDRREEPRITEEPGPARPPSAPARDDRRELDWW
jgi:hypothetical protein